MFIKGVTFLWPGFMVLLALIPLLVVVYLRLQRRKRKFALRYSSLALIRPALGRQPNFRRRVPPALFLLSLTSLVVTLARPVSTLSVPKDMTTVILAIDVSASMSYDDILPSRLDAAKSVVVDFINRQKPNTRIGLVQFSSSAQVILPPTTDHQTLITSVQGLTIGQETAIGSGILTSLDAIARLQSQGGTAQPVRVGGSAYAPEIIVLLTDGVSNLGPAPLDAARAAVTRKVRIFPIGFGTKLGFYSLPDQSGSGQPPGSLPPLIPNTGGGSNISQRGIDEGALKTIAKMTGGRYYAPESASELESAFANLPVRPVSVLDAYETSPFFLALGGILAAAALVLSLLWHPLP